MTCERERSNDIPNMKATSNSSPLSRRKFLRVTTTTAATAGVASSFMILKPSVLGRAGQASPNSKLNIAGIGVGGQGGSDINDVKSENIVALCDVDWDYAAKTFKKYPNAKKYKD